jgi:hypothetical protein
MPRSSRSRAAVASCSSSRAVVHPTPPAGETPVDTDADRVAAVDRGERGSSWSAEDTAARITAALDLGAVRPPATPGPVPPSAAVAIPVGSPPDTSDGPAEPPDQPTPRPGPDDGDSAAQDPADPTR